MKYNNPIESIYKNKLVAVIRADEEKEALEMAKAVIQGGIKVLEITVENGIVLPAIKELKESADVTIMAGGIITQQRAQEAIKMGADCIVSPVFQISLLKFCLASKIPHICTVSTPNEAYNAWKSRIPIIKIYPTKSMGGVEYVEDMLRPMPFLNIMPSGGIELDDIEDYIKAGVKAIGLGRCLYQNADLKEITNRARFAVSKIEKYQI